jgi:hypothetical protein
VQNDEYTNPKIVYSYTYGIKEVGGRAESLWNKLMRRVKMIRTEQRRLSFSISLDRNAVYPEPFSISQEE